MAASDMSYKTALRLYGDKDIRLDLVSPQSCSADEIRVKVAFCGICGSDLHEYNTPTLCPKPGQKHPLTGCSLPVTLGHEISGTISEIGAEVSSLKVGDRVVINPQIVERHVGKEPCETCKLGFPNICTSASNYGLGGPGGGFAEELVVKSYSALRLPDGISLEAGALVEPFAVAWHSVRTAKFKPGQDALILGAGPIGLAILQVLRVRGARNIIVSEVLDFRLKQSVAMGATATVNPLDGEDVVIDQVKKACNGQGVDVAFDASGLQATLDTAIVAVKPRGTIYNVAIHERPLLINPTQISLQEKIFRGGNSYTNEDFEAVINALAAGSLVIDGMVTSIVPLKNSIENGFGMLRDKKSEHVKILIQPS